MKSLKRHSAHQSSGVSSPSKAASCASPLRPRSLGVLAAVGALLITGCEVEPEAEDDGGVDSGDIGDPGDEESLQAPDPQGDQISHDEMRDVLSENVADARLTDTDNYMAGLRDVETELARLVVDPQDCKQYVVQSASPVPEGALVVFADNTAADGGADPAPSEGEQPADDAAEGEGDEGGQPGEDDDDGEIDQPESRGGGGFTFSSVISSLSRPFENDGAEDSEESGVEDDSAEEGNAPEDDEAEDSEADLPDDRQVTVYSFQDSLAAEAHFSNELDGVENCSAYTVERSGPDGDEAETESSITEVEIDSPAEEAIGMTRELSYDETAEHSVIVMLREGSQVVVLGVPVEEELEDEEAEAAVEDLEPEATAILEDLLDEDL